MVETETIAFCESGKQAAWLLSHPSAAGGVTRYIAVNPDAFWAFQTQGREYTVFESFRTTQPAARIEKLLAGQIRWAKNVDAFLQKAVPQFGETGFCPARYYLFYLNKTWDTFISLAETLENLYHTSPPGHVVFFSGRSPCTYEATLTPQGSALATMLRAWAAHHHIEATVLPDLPGDAFWEIRVQTRRDPVRSIKNLVRSLPGSPAYRALAGIFHRRPASLPPGNAGCPPARIVLRQQYDLNRQVSMLLQEKGVEILDFDAFLRNAKRASPAAPIPETSLAAAWEEAARQDWFWYPGCWQDIPVREVLSPLFYHFWFSVIPALWQDREAAAAALRRARPGAIAAGNTWGTAETALLMAARQENVPVVFYQHGASMGDIENSVWDLIDRYFADYELVFGDGEAEYLGQRPGHGDAAARPVPVGSSRLDAIRAGRDPSAAAHIRKKILGGRTGPMVVYVPGVLSNNICRYDHTCFRHCATFNLRQRVAEIFRSRPEITFVYKPFVSQGNDPTLEMLKEACPSCRIVDTVLLSDLQWAADVLVYEVPSTGMYEGLLTDKKIIVYADRDTFAVPPGAAELLKQRVTLAESGEDLARAIQDLIHGGDFGPVQNLDTAFLRRFCTHRDDGGSAARAASAIADILCARTS